jgi:hypothetical protein
MHHIVGVSDSKL